MRLTLRYFMLFNTCFWYDYNYMCHHWSIDGMAYWCVVWFEDDPTAMIRLDEGILNDVQEEVGI